VEKVVFNCDTTNAGGILSKDHGNTVLAGTVLEYKKGEIPERVQHLIRAGVCAFADLKLPEQEQPDLDPLDELLAQSVEKVEDALTAEEKTTEALQILLEKEAAGKNRKTVREFIEKMIQDREQPDPGADLPGTDQAPAE
jgi:hypothetical protein